MDDLSEEMNSMFVGCCIGKEIVNHLIYADDIALISPSRKGLQRLLNTCAQYGRDHGIVFNARKSAVLIVRSKGDKNLIYPSLSLNEQS